MAKKSSILTGGTGKAGHWIVKRRSARGHDVAWWVDTPTTYNVSEACGLLGIRNAGLEPSTHRAEQLFGEQQLSDGKQEFYLR